MPYPLNAYATVDTFQPGGEVQFSPPVESFTMVVMNNQVKYQLAVSTGFHASGESYGIETQVPPGRYVFDPSDSNAMGGNGKLSAIRVRSAITGLPATVFVH